MASQAKSTVCETIMYIVQRMYNQCTTNVQPMYNQWTTIIQPMYNQCTTNVQPISISKANSDKKPQVETKNVNPKILTHFNFSLLKTFVFAGLN